MLNDLLIAAAGHLAFDLKLLELLFQLAELVRGTQLCGSRYARECMCACVC